MRGACWFCRLWQMMLLARDGHSKYKKCQQYTQPRHWNLAGGVTERPTIEYQMAARGLSDSGLSEIPAILEKTWLNLF